MNEEEEVEKESRLPPEKLKAIEVLAASGMANTEIAEAVDCSRKTAARYRPAETDGQQQEAQEEGEADKKPEVDTEASAAIFSIFDAGDGPITAIKEGHQVEQVNYLWKIYLRHKGVKHPRILNKKLYYLSRTLEHLLMNIRWIAQNATWKDGNKDIIWCEKCRSTTHLVTNEKNFFVCNRCGKRLFQVEEKNDG